MIWNRLRLEMENLPRAQKRVAEYMLENPSEALFMTSQQLGEFSETSEATVVRLAVTLGFNGFPAFKEALQGEAKDQLSTFGRLQEHRAKARANSLLSEVISEEMEAAASCLAASSDEEIKELASRIRGSDGVYLIGLRSTRSLAVYMQYYLSWFLPNVYVPQNDSLESYLVSASRNSLVVGISFPRYTRRTLDSILIANRMNLRTAAITDSDASPLAKVANMAVKAPCVHVAHIDSLMVPFGLANAILIEVANQLGPKALSRLDELEDVWAAGSVYC
ncbi:MAG: MurR/RpiR family transcriptional regulator [Synergistaceae bacterium]|jgi:DNA-binding MurR/RpiR family transcriptional regulator|nr:MurR/RpiR family transcriptional regulator [Synergistaceae bacterium]